MTSQTQTETVALDPTTVTTTNVTVCEPHDNSDWDTSITPNLRLLVPDRRLNQSRCPAKRGLDGANDGGTQPKSIEETGKRSLHHFPRSAIIFPMPALEFDFRVAVTLNQEPSRFEGRENKEIISIVAGLWSGSFGNGRITVLCQPPARPTLSLTPEKTQSGGYDLGQARGFRPVRIVEGAFILQTMDELPASLEMRTRGSLSGPCDILDTLLNPSQPKNIDPRRYGLRMFATLKSPDKRYAEIVNCGLWVASGVWHDRELIIE
ncbi:hypothetical protein CDD80_6322 [Ophiocordyceps camponoti-rufipedis]|uniref:Uncharacterized protein n=1 Tax=Ophiocordyceps camponoti-rufipedis TaxID=2004952 RepID=A0A2C5XVS9_9HYPO|nr:hypothetical protein CDD80_6322 [Ophiocordyceps camponoti-rufipedis]